MAVRDGVAPAERNGELILPAPGPARITTVEGLATSIDGKGSADAPPGLYHRDGTPEISRIEALLSEVTIPYPRLNVAVGAGMAAVKASTEASLSLVGRDENGQGPLLAHAEELYSQSPVLFQDLRNMGVNTTRFDSGDQAAIERLLEEKRPDVIFAETVANTPNMPVLDVHWLLQRLREMGDEAPILILDNTLPKKTGLDFDKLLQPDDKVLVVESITKAELHNGQMGVGGNIYGKNEELIEQVRRYRNTSGFVISTAAGEAYIEALEATLPDFHARNKALFASTVKLARALDGASRTLGDDSDFTVAFPALQSHPNYPYVRDHMPRRYAPKLTSPVVFMASKIMGGGGLELHERIANHPRMREQQREGQIYFGQSFGFPEATQLFDQRSPFWVRFSGGHDIDSAALAAALEEAAADI